MMRGIVFRAGVNLQVLLHHVCQLGRMLFALQPLEHARGALQAPPLQRRLILDAVRLRKVRRHIDLRHSTL